MLIIFDMGNVVSRSVDVLPPLSEKVGISEERLRHTCRDDFFGLTTGSITTDRFWELFSEHLGVDVPENYLATLFTPELDQDVAHLVEELRKIGHRVVCGTNTIDSHYRIHQQRGDYRVFDTVYASHLMGCAKPDAPFFDHILEAEREEWHQKDRVLFVDDLAENVEGALSAGLNAHLFTGIDGLLSFFAENGIAVPRRT